MDVKFGVFTPPRGLKWIYQTAELAEKLGNYDSVWMPDHLVGWGRNLDALSVWPTLTALGLKTAKIKVGTGVTDPHRLHPSVMAHVTMTMERILGENRVMIGIGAGEAMNLDAYGVDWEKPVSRLEEFLEIIKLLWRKRKVTYDGQFFKLKNAFISPRPKNIPLFVAGNRPRTRKITGQFGDGWFPFKVSPEIYARDLKEVQDAARAADRSPDTVTPGYLLYTVISEDADAAREMVERHGKILLMVSPNKLKDHGFEPPTYNLDASKSFKGRDPMKDAGKISEVPFEAIEKIFVHGTADDCLEQIAKYVDAGCRYFILGILNPGKERDEAITIYSEKIISYFQK
ncbi:MAG: LLM class flavin-dependent oxidoreductase [Candidatus Helarchaeota archaeon]|nr:LLM class flavin-dependent oxidoreductase [Candidatus Helarchaeota archaeon]